MPIAYLARPQLSIGDMHMGQRDLLQPGPVSISSVGALFNALRSEAYVRSSF